MNICVYGAASSKIDSSFKEAGIKLGKKMAKKNIGLVFGGGRNGMMGAVAEGMAAENGNILGISPAFFEESNAEISYPNCTEFIHTETMRERKRLLEEKSDAFIISPGGIGTFDEFFEILTLKQLGRHNKAICIFNIDGYFDKMLEMMQVCVDKHFITEDCRCLYKVYKDIDSMLDYIEKYDPEDIDLSRVKIR